MSTFTSQRSILRNIVLSPNVQNAIGEVMADANLTYLSREESNGFAQIVREMESDYNYTSKGLSAATESRLIAQSSTLELSTRLDDFLVGYAFAMCMRNYAFTAGADDAPNTHAITWKDTSDPALLTNVYIEDAAGLKRKWSDLALKQIVLSGTDKGSITIKMSFIGLGTVTVDVAGAMETLPALPVAQYLYGSDSVVSIGPTGAPVSKVPRVQSWELTFDHQDELYRACGTGVKPAFIRQGNPVCKAKFVVAIDTSSDIFDWMTNQTPLEIKVVVNSGATSLTVDYPNVILPKSDLMEQDKYVSYTIDLDENSILQPTGGGEPVSVTVLNTQAAYLVAA